MTASQRAYGGRRTAQGGEVDASTADRANRAFVRAVGRIRKPPLTEDAQAVIARSMTEKQLQASVEELARLLGWLVYHTYDSRRSAPGFPDLVMARDRDRRLIFAELKRERGRCTPDQEDWHNVINMAGTPAYVWRPSDWLSGRIERVLRGEDA